MKWATTVMRNREIDLVKTLLGFAVVLVLGLGISGQVNLIPESAKFSSDARVEFTKDPNAEYRKTNNLPPFEPKPYSIGTTNGIPYLFYFEDGRGEIEGLKGNGVDLTIDHRDVKNWTLRCSRSAPNNDKHCGVIKGELTVINILLKDGTSLFWITTLETPDGGGFPEVICVDDGPAYMVTDPRGRFATAVIDEMKTGKKVTVRRGRGSEGPDIVHTFDLHGFKEALALCEWAVRQID